MQRFVARLLLFSVPFALYALAILIVDPFVRFDLFHVAPESTKQELAEPVNYALWTTLSFDRRPAANVLIGDSRMQRLDEAAVTRAAGRPFRNLSMGGASALEMVNMFWHAADRVTLESAYLGVDLENINVFMSRDRVQAAESVERNPLLYFTSRDVTSASYSLLSTLAKGAPRSPQRPPMSQGDFWQYQLDVATTRDLYGFAFDEKVFGELAKIAQYCREHHVLLEFVLLPTHEDLRAKVRSLGLGAQANELVERLRALAPTVDLDEADDETRDRSNFIDPFHMGPQLAASVVGKVWPDPHRDETAHP